MSDFFWVSVLDVKHLGHMEFGWEGQASVCPTLCPSRTPRRAGPCAMTQSKLDLTRANQIPSTFASDRKISHAAPLRSTAKLTLFSGLLGPKVMATVILGSQFGDEGSRPIDPDMLAALTTRSREGKDVRYSVGGAPPYLSLSRREQRGAYRASEKQGEPTV